MIYHKFSWGILFSHPADYTPVCTTELGRVAKLYPEFIKRNVKPIALSCDSVESHIGWIDDIKSYSGINCVQYVVVPSDFNLIYIFKPKKKTGVTEFQYPIIDDKCRELAVKLNMLDKDEIGNEGLPLTCRAVFVVDHNKKLRLSILYPATTGRNFE